MEEKKNIRVNSDDIMNKMIFIGDRRTTRQSDNLVMADYITDSNDNGMTSHKPSVEEIGLQSDIDFLKKNISLLKMKISNYDNMANKVTSQTNSNYKAMFDYSTKDAKNGKEVKMNSKDYKKMIKPGKDQGVREKLQGYSIEELAQIIKFQNSRLGKLEEKISPQDDISLLEQSNLPLKPTFNMMTKAKKPKYEKGKNPVDRIFERIERKLNRVEEKGASLREDGGKLEKLVKRNEEFRRKVKNIEEGGKPSRRGLRSKKLTRSVKTLKPINDIIIDD